MNDSYHSLVYVYLQPRQTRVISIFIAQQIKNSIRVIAKPTPVDGNNPEFACSKKMGSSSRNHFFVIHYSPGVGIFLTATWIVAGSVLGWPTLPGR